MVPATINVRGEGIFPRLLLSLPRVSQSGTMVDPSLSIDEFLEQERLNVAAHCERVDKPGEVVTDKVQPRRKERGEAQGARNQTPHMSSSKAVMATYVCDFGDAIQGVSLEKIITVTNNANRQVSFDVEKKAIKQMTRFDITPEKIKHFPARETTELCVKLSQTGARSMKGLGLMEGRCRIDMHNGPTIVVIIRAFITIPELVLSRTMINFNANLSGCRTVETLQLHNPKTAPCSWKFKHGSKKFDADHFEVTPRSGTLLPDAYMNVKIKFTPTVGQKYQNNACIIVDQNPTDQVVTLCGEGIEPALEFSTNIVELGPVLPYGPTATKTFVVRNPMDIPIELYSLDFDKQYAQE